MGVTGGCLCGGVSYEIKGKLRDVVNCHCGQCRKTHGHFAAYSSVAKQDLVLTSDSSLRWYESTPGVAKRGFCNECGASLFWKPVSEPRIAVAAGSMDAPTGLRTTKHVFVDDAGDYYEFTDNLEKIPGTMRKPE